MRCSRSIRIRGCARLTRRCCRPPARRTRGEIHAERVIAEAKLIDATSIEDAVEWLAPQERMVVLHDRALIDMLTRLPKGSEAAGAAAA